MLGKFFKLPDWLQHILFSWLLMLIFSMLTFSVVTGAVAGTLYYFGREQRDNEIRDASFYDKLKTLMFWKWSKDSLTDFIAPAIACWAIVMLKAIL